MALPPFGRWFLHDVLKPETREALLCLGRKNAKSAIVALFCLGHLVGPLAGKGGWRAGVASGQQSEGSERLVGLKLSKLLRRAGWRINSSFGGPLGRGRFRLQRGRWKSWPGTAVWAGIRPPWISRLLTNWA